MHRRTLAPLNINSISNDDLIKYSSKKKIPTSTLPDFLRSIFPYEYFNPVQSECFQLAFETNENLVVSAPTGTGKTVVAELAIARILQEVYAQDTNQDNDTKPPLIVYVSPLKSLCQERATSWIQKFKQIPELQNLDVTELTSDTQSAFPRKVKKPTIICTTPEKLDLATRSMKGTQEELSLSSKTKKVRRRNHKCCESFDQLSLVIFDEVHNMSDSRGAVLEAVMSRILFISDQNSLVNEEACKIRVVALSATIHNYADFKQWLKVKHDTVFDDSYRSTTIDTRIFGYSTTSSSRGRINDWMFESSLTAKVTPIVRQYSKGKPVLIFCCTRKSCEKTAVKLATDFSPTRQEQKQQQQELFEDVRDKTLLLTLKSGVGIHTAGLCPSDRGLVEHLFMTNKVRILCTTSTLSQGVNLPAYLVVIKGTKHFTDGSLEEYDSTQILQMQGRAGRPQFEKEGVCVIMTEKDNVKKYEKMISQSDPIESSLLDNLEEHLNAEIALGFINEEEDVLRWLMSTFLYIRMQKNPFHYKLTNASNASKFLQKLSSKHLKELEKHKFIKCESGRIIPEDVGSLCSQYGVLIGTMILFNESSTPRTLKSVLSLLCKAYEFANDVIVRQEEKQKLRLMSVQPKLRFLSEDADNCESIFANNNYTAEAKVLVLIDTVLSMGKIDEWSLSQEFSRIKRTSERLIACMMQLMASPSKRSFHGAVNCAVLLKCIKRQMWENDTERLAQQVKGIGEVYAKKISSGFCAMNGGSQNSQKMTMRDLRKMTSYQIDKLTNHRTGWGMQIVDEIQKIPEYSLSFQKKVSEKSGVCEGILINLTNLSHFDPISPFHKADVFVGVKKKDLLLDYFHIKKVVGHINKTFTVYLDEESLETGEISVYVIDSEYIGIDLFQSINMDSDELTVTHCDAETNQVNQEEEENDDDICEEVEVDVQKSSEMCEKSPYFKNSCNTRSDSAATKNAPSLKQKSLSDTKMTQYFQVKEKPIEVSRQRVQALCPEIFEEYYNDDEDKERDYEVVWPKPQIEPSSLQSVPQMQPGTRNDDDDECEVVWSMNKKVASSDNHDDEKEGPSKKNISREPFQLENFKLDDDFWENLEFDEQSD